MNNPLVTITIPTYNSAAFLDICISAIKNQTYKNIEINVVDGGSKDSTVDKLRSLGVTNIIINTKSLLASRFDGVKSANGEYVLMLDSDQVLESTAIETGVKMFQEGLDILALEEDVYSDKTFIEKLFKYDRKLVESVKDYDPNTSVILPRFYKKSILMKAFESIPETVLNKVGGQDHAIIYYEAWQLTHKVSSVPNAVKHMEPDTPKKMWKKFYRWGATSVDAHFEKYDELLKKKERFRKGMFQQGLLIASFASIGLLLFKGVPYFAGYYVTKFKKGL